MHAVDRMARHTRRAQRGLALVAVLWVVAALALLVGSLTVVARTETRVALDVSELGRATALGDAAIQLALLELRADPSPARHYRLRDLVVEGVPVRVRIQSVAGFVDLNGAPEALLVDLLTYGGGLDPVRATGLAQRIIDWRDPDDVPGVLGAEAQAYAAAGVSYRARNAPFIVVEDLMQVLGMSLDLYEAVRPLVTVWGGHAAVDPAAADVQLIRVLAGGDERLAASLATRRDQGDPTLDTTSLRHASVGAEVRDVFRVEAMVALGEGTGRRVRWVTLSRDERGGPWTSLDVQAATVER
jgi:general secretion pathway protein K